VKNEDSQHPFNERIIWKYFDGTATSEEEQELSQWLATSEKHRREVAELRAVRQRFDDDAV
jgi:anti-sigma factor RsiW